MISISTTTASTTGNVVLLKHDGSKLREKPMRISRVKTLDGGVYINHGGYSAGDRILSISAKITKSQETIINSMGEGYTSFLISFIDGLFLGSISNLTAENGELSMTIYLEEKEN